MGRCRRLTTLCLLSRCGPLAETAHSVSAGEARLSSELPFRATVGRLRGLAGPRRCSRKISPQSLITVFPAEIRCFGNNVAMEVRGIEPPGICMPCRCPFPAGRRPHSSSAFQNRACCGPVCMAMSALFERAGREGVEPPIRRSGAVLQTAATLPTVAIYPYWGLSTSVHSIAIHDRARSSWQYDLRTGNTINFAYPLLRLQAQRPVRGS